MEASNIFYYMRWYLVPCVMLVKTLWQNQQTYFLPLKCSSTFKISTGIKPLEICYDCCFSSGHCKAMRLLPLVCSVVLIKLKLDMFEWSEDMTLFLYFCVFRFSEIFSYTEQEIRNWRCLNEKRIWFLFIFSIFCFRFSELFWYTDKIEIGDGWMIRE